MFLATRVCKESVFNAYFTWEKKNASFDKYRRWKPFNVGTGILQIYNKHNLLIRYNKFIKLQPFIIVFVDVSATVAAFVRTTVHQV